jgi:para-nitrobenzyl esterase
MNTIRSWRATLAAACCVALTFAAAGATAARATASASGSGSGGGPVVTTGDGAVRGVAVPGGYAFRGLPYAAPPMLIPGKTVTAGSYQPDIAAVLGVSDARAAAIAAEYPLAAYPSPAVAFSALAGDANFACPALRIDQLTSQHVPAYAYEFNDDTAPPVFSGPIIPPPVATHASELRYLFDLPNAPVPTPLSAGQQALAASMRTAWADFAATGNPATAAAPWPAFNTGSARMLSLVPPQPQIETDFASRHHCAFWAGG